ncbi:hypothetical protein [Haloechinothrix halophila]|uniref:hypothetical protein n=1 Tax=Haloechinothrix halophila TaxID=1069073 RepID=UPI0012FAF776|nr:hypothetical protein [Haloechinothrix halophila]
MRTRTRFTAVLLLSPALAACVNPVADDAVEIGVDRATLEQEAHGAGVPVLVPERLPSGYQMLDVSSSRSAGGHVGVREFTISRIDGEQPSVIFTCVQDKGAQLCDGDEEGKRSLRRTVDSAEVVIRWDASDSAVDTAFWREVPFTTELDNVDWLT